MTEFDYQIENQRQDRLQRLRDLDLSKQLRTLLGKSIRFRANQEEILQAIMDRKSPILAILPTGLGKSLLFQLPASIDFLGVTIVILPLLSLLQSQLARARALNISATIFDSRNPPDSVQLVFTTPESSITSDFQNFLSRLEQFKRLDRIVIDECHEILNSTNTFRKNIRRLGELLEKKTQIILLTATLPPKYESSLFDTLYLSPEKVFKYRLSSNRSNIRYSVYSNQSSNEILERIRIKSIQYSIDRLMIYTRTIVDAKDLAEQLEWPIYHSKSLEKERVLRKFLDPSQTSQRIIATSALGLGLDTPNIRVIFHINRPYRLYQYSQETGRAGRDGRSSEAILLLSSSDNSISNRSRIDRYENEIIDEYLTSNFCRRSILRQYLDGGESSYCDKPDIDCDICVPNDSGK